MTHPLTQVVLTVSKVDSGKAMRPTHPLPHVPLTVSLVDQTVSADSISQSGSDSSCAFGLRSWIQSVPPAVAGGYVGFTLTIEFGFDSMALHFGKVLHPHHVEQH